MAKGIGNGAGRPTVFTPELGVEICLRIMTYPFPTNSLTQICAANDMPCRKTLYLWVLDASKNDASDDQKEFIHRYAISDKIKVSNMFDEMLYVSYDDDNDLIDNDKGSIGNSTNVSRSKLKVDTLKWALSKLNPNKYGERIQQEHSGNIGGGATVEQIASISTGVLDALAKLKERVLK